MRDSAVPRGMIWIYMEVVLEMAVTQLRAVWSSVGLYHHVAQSIAHCHSSFRVEFCVAHHPRRSWRLV